MLSYSDVVCERTLNNLNWITVVATFPFLLPFIPCLADLHFLKISSLRGHLWPAWHFSSDVPVHIPFMCDGETTGAFDLILLAAG